MPVNGAEGRLPGLQALGTRTQYRQSQIGRDAPLCAYVTMTLCRQAGIKRFSIGRAAASVTSQKPVPNTLVDSVAH